MSTLTSSTFKSAYVSLGLHVVFVVLGSWAFYHNSVHTLELTGASGGVRKISLSGINFSAAKKSVLPSKVSKTLVTTKMAETIAKTTTDTVTATNSSVSAAVTGGSATAINGTGSSAGSGSGEARGDADNGRLFGQIRTFFETRLGSTLNIRENQLIKIKVTLNKEGDVLDAILVQGQLEMSALRRVISIAKNIPLKTFWKTGAFPNELIIPLVLTPG